MPDQKPEDCKTCSGILEIVHDHTRGYLLKMLKEIQDSGDHVHLAPPAVLLVAIDSMTRALGIALESQKKNRMTQTEGTAVEKQMDCREMESSVVQGMFQIMEDNLPIHIQATHKVAQADVSKIKDYVDGLKAQPEGKVQH